MPTGLFVCYGGGHAQIVIPIVRELQKRPGWRAEVLAATTAGPEMARRGIEAFGYTRLLEPNDLEAKSWGERLLKDSHDPSSGISIEESIAYLGLCFTDLVGRLGIAEARQRYDRYGRHAFLPIGPLRRAIAMVHADVVVTTNAPKSERAALLAAREMRIPAVYIEDLLGVHTGEHMAIVPAAPADRYCVGSSIAAENVMRLHGVSRDRIRMTGNPAFDRLAQLGPAHRNRGRLTLGLAGSDVLVAYLDSSATPPEHIARLAAEVRRAPHARLAVRRHPNRRTMDGAAYIAATGGNVTLAEDIGLDELLMAADVVVTVASTTALEAVLVGGRVIQLGAGTGIPALTGDRAEDLALYAQGAATLVEDLDELAAAIQDAMRRPEAELRVAAARVFVPPGTAAAAIVEEMAQLVRS